MDKDLNGADTKLRILIVEDSPSQSKRMEEVLRSAEILFTAKRVDTKEAFADAMAGFLPDIILCDHKLRQMDSLQLLKTARRDHPEIPVILVSSVLSDIEAVELIQSGARDYVLKNRLVRLPTAVLHALETEMGIRERKAAEQALREASAKLDLFRTLIDQSTDGIEVIDPRSLRFLDVNEAECRSLGYSREELLSMSVFDIDPTFNSELDTKIDEKMRQSGCARFEGVHRRKDGTEFPVEINAKWIELDRPYALAVVRDITERRKGEKEFFRINRALQTLGDGNRALLRANSESELMKNMCKVITAASGYMLAWIGLVKQDEERSIEPVAISGTGKNYVKKLRLSWGECPGGKGPTATGVRTGQTQIVQDIANDPRFESWRKAATKQGYAACISLPLKEKDSVFGALNIYSGEKSAFGKREVELLEQVASDLAFGIVNLRTREERDRAVTERQKYAERLRTSLEEALQAISATLEMRDPYTAGHERRVAHLAVAIAREMGLDAEVIHGIHLAGIVHDLGKIHIPAEILSKPGRLNEIEYSFIKIHPKSGYDILKEIEFPWPIAQAVLQHHERMDGSGYPHGLKGEKIILEARILAVADVVEAMSSHRPYRAGLGKKAAIEEITKHRGTFYDPEVVDACIRLFLEKKYHLPKA